jgi:hypothetical protein
MILEVVNQIDAQITKGCNDPQSREADASYMFVKTKIS